MDEGRQISDQEFVYLSRALNLLRYWPVERLRGNPQVSTVYYFDRNQVLVRDSKNSEWIYVVLKGSLSVLKKLPRLEPQPSRCGPMFASRNRRRRANFFSDDINEFKSERVKVRQKTLPSTVAAEQEESFKTQFELETKLNQTLPGYYNINDRLKSLDYDKIIARYQLKLVTKGTETDIRTSLRESTRPSFKMRSTQRNSDQLRLSTGGPLADPPGSRDINRHFTPLPDIRGRNTATEGATSTGSDGGPEITEGGKLAYNEHSEAKVQDVAPNKSKIQRSRKLGISYTLKGAYLAPSTSQIQAPIDDPTPEGQPRQDQASPRPQNVRVGDQVKPENVRQKLARLQMEYQRRFNDREGRRTIAEDLDHKARRDYVITETDLDPMFIEVQVLERGQYFGIAPLLFHDEPSLSVVSNGAECLVISKKHFMAWANDKCLRYLRQTESPYPRDTELSRKLQDAINWRAHRTQVYQILDHRIRERRARRKQFLPAYIGQYCFRTGPA